MSEHGMELIPTELSVTLKRDTVTVREIRINDLRKIASSLMVVVAGLPPEIWEDEKLMKNPMKFLKLVLDNDDFFEAIKQIIAQVIDKDVNYVSQLGMVDQIKIIKAFFVVNDVKEIKELFLETMEVLGINQGKVSSPNAEPNSQETNPTH